MVAQEQEIKKAEQKFRFILSGYFEISLAK
jgi:hypothetical protein